MSILHSVMQCTWGFFQSILGAFVFCCNFRCPHFYYHGAVVTIWSGKTSLSLGMFLFLGRKELLTHEYGHTIQSLLLGPLYLLVIGLPSLLWCCLPCLVEKRRKQNISYFSFYTEKWADRLGEAVCKRWN